MTTPTTITIDNQVYVRADHLPAGPPAEMRIIVADRGWVFVGNCTDEENGAVTITNAKCIRYWGTDNDKPGLGYLALNGPTSKTKLDQSGTVRIPKHALVASFDVKDASAWL